MSVSAEKEYELKWQYVMHTEVQQGKFIQWYMTVCSAIFVLLYSSKIELLDIPDLGERRWVITSILILYSVLICLRLLMIKRNYDTYTSRIRTLENAKLKATSIRPKWFSVFKLQYYVICIVGALTASALTFELGGGIGLLVISGAAYFIVMAGLSFSPLLGND